MTLHERNISASIDPVKLDRLAEVAIKVGLQPAAGAGSAADRARRGAAAGAQDRRACLQGRRRPRDPDFLRRGDDAGALSLRRRTTVSTAPPAGSMRAWRRRLPPTPPGSPSSATIRCCSPAKTPPRSSRASKANSIAYQPALEKIVGFDINWNIIAYPSPSWAKQVFPDRRGGCRGGQAGGCDLRGLARRQRQPGRGLGEAQRRAARAAPNG